MIAETEKSIIEQVRTLKEENAAEHGFDLEAIIESARNRQEASGRPIIRLSKGERFRSANPIPSEVGKSDG